MQRPQQSPLPALSRAQRNCGWVEQHCLDRGQVVQLTPTEREIIARIYDHPSGDAVFIPVEGRLGTYLVLLHVCGFEARTTPPPPEFQTNIFSLWAASENPLMRSVLRRHGDRLVCPELGTGWPSAA